MFRIFLILALCPWLCQGQYQPFWEVNEINFWFAGDNRSNNPPGLPGGGFGLDTRPNDDDFYRAGFYPGRGNFSGDSERQIENVLSNNDPTNRLHFVLSNSQAANSAFRFTITFQQPAINSSTVTASSHQVRFSFNSTPVFTTPVFGRVNAQSTFSFHLPSDLAIPGQDNVLTMTRIAGSPNSQIRIREFNLERDPNGGRDQDNDGLPARYEADHFLSDSNGSDASADPDGDSLTTLQEYQLGTHPLKADTDGDGLNDNLETSSNPLLADTDGDGISDAEEQNSGLGISASMADSDNDGDSDSWELAVGTSPSLSSSRPPTVRSIGVNFVSIQDPENSVWSKDSLNGLIPQPNWNHTYPMLEVPSRSDLNQNTNTLNITRSHIQTPTTGRLVDANGTVLGTNFSMRRTFVRSRSSQGRGSSLARLLNGNIEFANTSSAGITFSNIPYSNYDVYLYLAAVHDIATENHPIVNVTANSSSSPIMTQQVSVYPVSSRRDYALALNAPSIPANSGTPALSTYANTVRFENLSGSSLFINHQVPVINVQDENGNVTSSRPSEAGLAAIQIVERNSDADNDNLPDYWELRYRTGVTTANGNADPDNDQLSNAQEFALNTDPNHSDTDRDGLSDSEEQTLGTDPTNPDSDGDLLTDFQEVTGPQRSNPLNADSDGDGESDRDELEGIEEQVYTVNNPGADYSSIHSPTLPTRPSVNSFIWEISGLQIIWNHNSPQIRNINSNEGLLYQAEIQNLDAPFNNKETVAFRLREENAGLNYRFVTRKEVGFIKSSGSDLVFELNPTDTGNFNLLEKLGFSGFGEHDISDPLTILFEAQLSSAPNWTVTAQIINEATGVTVVDRQNTTSTASSVITSIPNPTYSSRIRHGEATTIIRTLADIQNLPPFSDSLDANNDGIPDAWFTLHNLSSAQGDNDGDGLTNRQEFYYGTLPNNPDSDGDGARDNFEVLRFTNPRDAQNFPTLVTLPTPLIGDFDGNGLRDLWELSTGFTGLDGAADSDGDGVTNRVESIAGTNPLSANSKPYFTIEKMTDDMARLRWPVLSGTTQTLESSSNLAAWNSFTALPTITNSAASLVVDTSGNEAQFYRQIISESDQDNDGVTDREELLLGSSPTKANSTSQAVPVDLNMDGIPESSISGDYATLASFFQNGANLASGGDTSTPTQRDAARLLMQGSFGPTLDDIQRVQSLGIEGWIDDQYSQPVTSHEAWIKDTLDLVQGPSFSANVLAEIREDGFNDLTRSLAGTAVMVPFARAAVLGEDQLRQRVAFALSQIFVASRRDDILQHRPWGLTHYYDIFVRNAFGNYFDILQEVTAHPIMGTYLSHIGNSKPQPEINIFPDENYAREVMQLFSIGLWELNQDGTRKIQNGLPIATYDTFDVTEMARVMTGYWFDDARAGGSARRQSAYATPMRMIAQDHDFESKNILKGRLIIPSRAQTEENALQDIEDALRTLFLHPNTAPFISRALIKFLVTDNPSPAYVTRVADVFDGSGGAHPRGDLGAVIKAILMDPEARDPAIAEISENYGRLRDPLVRYMHLARLTGMEHYEDFSWWDTGRFLLNSGQTPLRSPSVFNFYRPDYSPPGLLTENDLEGGSFQILNNYTAVALPNHFWQTFLEGFRSNGPESDAPNLDYPVNFSEALPFAENDEALLDYVNLTACGGRMSASTREFIRLSLQNTYYTRSRRIHQKIALALYGAFISPEGAIQQ